MYKQLSMAIFISVSLFAQAAEDGSFPGPHAELRPAFASYIDASHKGLANLDSLAQSGDGVAGQWVAQCRQVKTQLSRARVAAINQFNRGGGSGPLLPDDVLQWYQAEARAWDSIETIGKDMITLHDQILEQTGKIRNQLIPQHRKKAETIKSWAGVADQMVGTLLDGAVDHGRTAAQETTMLNRAIQDTARLVAGVNTINEEAKNSRTSLERANYRPRLEALARKDIDPDQKGVFVGHERAWEAALSQALQNYDQTYQEYNNEVQAIQSYEILTGYRYLASMPKVPRAVDAWLKKRLTEAKKETKANVVITANRIPSRMQFGEEAIFEVMVNNKGAKALAAGSWTVECKTDRAPSGASGTFAYRHDRCPALPAGRAVRLTQRVTAPPGVGAWELSWTAKSGSSTLSEQKGKVTVQGEASAAFSSVSGPRSIRQGRSERLNITIENTGDTPIEARDLSVEVKPTRSPSGYRPARDDFSLKLRPRRNLVRGSDLDFTESISPPADPKAVGDWVLEVELKLAGRVVERRTLSLKVEAR